MAPWTRVTTAVLFGFCLLSAVVVAEDDWDEETEAQKASTEQTMTDANEDQLTDGGEGVEAVEAGSDGGEKKEEDDDDWSWLNEEEIEKARRGEYVSEYEDLSWEEDEEKEYTPMSRYALKLDHFEGFINTRRLCLIFVYNDDNDEDFNQIYHAISLAHTLTSGQLKFPMKKGARLNITVDFGDISAEDFPEVLTTFDIPSAPALLVYRRGRLLENIPWETTTETANKIKLTIEMADNATYWGQMPKVPRHMWIEANYHLFNLSETNGMLARMFGGGIFGMLVVSVFNCLFGLLIPLETQYEVNQKIDNFLPKFMQSGVVVNAGEAAISADDSKACTNGNDEYLQGELRKRGTDQKHEM